MTSRFQIIVLSLAVGSVGLAAIPSAFADTININFICSGSNSGASATGLYTSGSNLCTTTNNNNLANTSTTPHSNAPDLDFGPVASQTGFTKWTQGTSPQFTVTTTGSTGSPEWNINQGEANNANTAGVSYVPALTTTSAGKTLVATVTDGGGLFQFASVDLKFSGSNMSYDVEGFLNSSVVFDLICGNGGTGSHCTALNGNTYVTVSGALYDIPADYINDLVITETGTTTAFDYLDNIDLITPAPEPNSLLLLGSGLLGIAFVLRRRLSA